MAGSQQGWRSAGSGGGGGGVQSVSGLNTDNTDPLNPIVEISVDGSTITGDGTPLNPLQANANYQTIEDEGNPLPQEPVLDFQGAGVNVTSALGKTIVTIAGSTGTTPYYLNQSINQAPYKEFSSVPTATPEVSVPLLVPASTTSIISSFQTPPNIPNTTNLIGGLWTFYLHFSGTLTNSWEIFVEVYSRTNLGVETLLLTTDSAITNTLSPTIQMIQVDGVLPTTTLLTTDRIVVKVNVKNTSLAPQTITFYTEGSTNYSVANTTLNISVPIGAVTQVTASAPVTSSGGTTPNIAIPQATALVDGYLDNNDFQTFDNKVDSVSGTAPIVSSGGKTPAISIPQATALVDGYLDNNDFQTFDNKVDSVTGLNTDNTDPKNPVVQISVDGTTIVGDGTPLNPLEVGNLINLSGNNYILTSSTQWSRTLPAPVPLPNGGTANGFTFFTDADKVAGGTTPYNEYTTDYGISIILSGTSGTANINVNGVNYLATFSVDLFTTANNWVTANKPTLNALGIQVFALGSGAVGQIRFGYTSATLLNNITITNVSGTLSGTKQNTFTGGATAVQDHLVIPYTGTPYDGLRIFHTIRANFNIATGSVQYASLGLYRYADDSLIGSTITVLRTPDTTGSQVVLESYTNSSVDPFVTGGFYVALKNNTGVTLDFFSSTGILIQNIFQKPVNFP